MASMDVERAAGTSSQDAATPHSIRITRHGKLRFWVKKALDFFKNHPDRSLVLYSAPAEISASTIARLVTVVEIVKREYLKGLDVSAGDVSGLHQYNQLLYEQQGRIPEEGEDRGDTLRRALDGHSHAKQSLVPHMKITLSIEAMDMEATHQTPVVRRMSKAAKARMRRRLRKQDEVATA